jgi:hypothetical protein
MLHFVFILRTLSAYSLQAERTSMATHQSFEPFKVSTNDGKEIYEILALPVRMRVILALRT